MKNNIFTGVINILGTDIHARLVEQDIYSFGETSQREVVRLDGPEVTGFINAIGDIKAGKYPVLKRGFHSHIDPENLEDIGDKKDQAYVDFAKLKDEAVLKMLKDSGIVHLEGRKGWLRLDVKDEQFIPASYAAPKLSRELYAHFLPADFDQLAEEDQKVARSEAIKQVHPSKFAENEHEWAIVHKQKGINLVQKLVAGKVRVICNANQSGFETRARVILQKFQLLFGENEAWNENRAEKIQNFRNNLATKTGGFYVRKYSDMEARADEVVQTEGLIVFVNGIAKEMNPTDLIAKRIELKMNGGASTNNFRFPRSVEEVKGVILFAHANNWGLFLNS